MTPDGTVPGSRALQARLQHAVAESNRAYVPAGKLAAPVGETIRAGRAGGLPFDSLVTDVQVGCLPASTACYGSCFAAIASFTAGIDFGIRVVNRLDEALLRSDLAKLPPTQRFLRIGWNSDPSWDWNLTARIAAILREHGLLTIAVTKSFTAIRLETLRRMAAAGLEMRVSVSAFDTDAQLRHRFDTMVRYRDAGGLAVPLVMTTCFAEADYQVRQERVLQDVIDRDLPGAENSLRFPPQTPVAAFLDRDAMRPLADSGDLWCGRLYPDQLVVPTTTSLPSTYTGLPEGYRSRLDRDYLATLFEDPVHTHDEVLHSPSLRKPTQCGVPRL